jgi:hypothetical protein
MGASGGSKNHALGDGRTCTQSIARTKLMQNSDAGNPLWHRAIRAVEKSPWQLWCNYCTTSDRNRVALCESSRQKHGLQCRKTPVPEQYCPS